MTNFDKRTFSSNLYLDNIAGWRSLSSLALAFLAIRSSVTFSSSSISRRIDFKRKNSEAFNWKEMTLSQPSLRIISPYLLTYRNLIFRNWLWKVVTFGRIQTRKSNRQHTGFQKSVKCSCRLRRSNSNSSANFASCFFWRKNLLTTGLELILWIQSPKLEIPQQISRICRFSLLI